MSERGGDPALIHRTIAGKFVVEKFLGGGAMGAVYRARQTTLDRKVAVKVMHGALTTDEAFVKRFKREAKAASKLDHPNSMRIIDYGEEPDGLLYIAMEYLEGRDLFRVIHEDWPLSNERIAGALMQALAAIAVAHDQGVIHRDLKPENIMVLRAKDDDGEHKDVVKVCDFGIAKITEGDDGAQSTADPSNPAARKLTTQGLVVGTPEYMSPEQARGEKLDPRSDLYSVGIILYQLLTGRTPFVADTPLAVVLKHISEVPVPPHAIYENVHRGLEEVCLKAIAKDREQRFQTAREMRAAIRAVMEGKPIPDIATANTEAIAALTNSTAPPANGATVVPSGAPPPMPASSKVTPLGTEAAPASGKARAVPAIVAVAALGILGGAGVFVVASKKMPHAARADEAPHGKVHAKALEVHEPIGRAAPATSASASESPPTPSSPPAPATPAPVSRCKAVIGKIPNKGAVRMRPGELPTKWSSCAEQLTEQPSGSATVHLRYNEEGRVASSTCLNCPASIQRCIESARPGVASQTGGEAVELDVPLTFTCD